MKNILTLLFYLLYFEHDSNNQPISNNHSDKVILESHSFESRFLQDSINEYYARFYPTSRPNSNSKMMYLVKTENNSPLWLVHPASDYGKEFPFKGISIGSDSAFINAPYKSGITAYTGLFKNYIAKGTHYSYNPIGKLKYSINYDTNTLIEYDSLGSKIRENLNYKRNLLASKIDESSLSFIKKDAELLIIE